MRALTSVRLEADEFYSMSIGYDHFRDTLFHFLTNPFPELPLPQPRLLAIQRREWKVRAGGVLGF